MAVVFFPRLFYCSCDIPSLSLAVLRWTGAWATVAFFAVPHGAIFAATTPAPVTITATWTGLPLLTATQRIADLAGIPISVDRRLDPNSKISLHCTEEPLAAVLDRVAAAAAGSVAVLRSSIRIVPAGSVHVSQRAEKLREQQLAQLPPSDRQLLARKRTWAWAAGESPRTILETAAREAGVRVVGMDALPHDHFPAAELPALTLAERFDLLLANFDRRIEWTVPTDLAADGGPTLVGTIVAVDTQTAAPVASKTLPTLPKRSSPAKPDRDSRRVADRSRPAPPTFSLRVEAPLEEVLAAVAAQLQVSLILDHDSLRTSGVSPREIVRVTIQDASAAALLDAILKPLMLKWTLAEQQLRVSGPAQE